MKFTAQALGVIFALFIVLLTNGLPCPAQKPQNNEPFFSRKVQHPANRTSPNRMANTDSTLSEKPEQKTAAAPVDTMNSKVSGSATEVADTNRIYEIVQVLPEYPGGMDAMGNFMRQNIVYPDSLQKKGIGGLVLVSFVIERDGSVEAVKAIRTPHPALGQEGERIVKLMPKWKPGRHDGKPVRVKFTLPIMFRVH